MSDAVWNSYYKDHLKDTGLRKLGENQTDSRTALIERMYVRVGMEMSANRFKWTGFPSSVNCRFLELELLRNALAVFYFDESVDKFLALRAGAGGIPNMMDDPTSFVVTGNKFITKRVWAKDCVPIWANYLRMPDWDIIQIYAWKLANLDRTIEINMTNARRTKAVFVEENQRLSAANYVAQIDRGEPVIYLNADQMQMIRDMIVPVDLGVNPDSLEKLHILRVRLWGEFCGLMGINYANQDKKERLVAEEVKGNDDQVSSAKAVALNARRQAAEEINLKWPELNVQVEYVNDYEERRAQLPEVGFGMSEEIA